MRLCAEHSNRQQTTDSPRSSCLCSAVWYLQSGICCLKRDSGGVGGRTMVSFEVREDSGPGSYQLVYVAPEDRGRGRSHVPKRLNHPRKAVVDRPFPSSNSPPLYLCMVAGGVADVNPNLGNSPSGSSGAWIVGAGTRKNDLPATSCSWQIAPSVIGIRLAAFLREVDEGRCIQFDTGSHG